MIEICHLEVYTQSVRCRTALIVHCTYHTLYIVLKVRYCTSGTYQIIVQSLTHLHRSVMPGTTKHRKKRRLNAENARNTRLSKIRALESHAEPEEPDDEEPESWIEFPDDEEDIINEIEMEIDDVAIQAIIRERFNWRDSGHNCNVRGAGTSRSTYFRNLAKSKSLEISAIGTGKITSFYKRKREHHQPDQYDTDYEDDVVDKSCDLVNLDLDAAIEQLSAAEAVSTRNEKDTKQLSFFVHQSTATLSYLSMLQEGFGKIEASVLVASVVFLKKQRSSYNALMPLPRDTFNQNVVRGGSSHSSQIFSNKQNG